MPYAIGHKRSPATLVVALLALLAPVTSGCTTQRALDRIVLARINEEPFTAQDLQDDYATIHGGHTLLLAGKGALREFLDKALERRLLVQEAFRIGLDGDPAIQERLRHIRRARAREGLLKDRLDAPVTIDPAEVQRAADRLKVVFDVRRIVLLTQEEAQAALARVRAGEDFGQVSSEISIGEGDRRRGGLLVGLTWGSLPRAVEERLYALQEGEVSEPFPTVEGWTILRVQRRIEREKAEIEKIRPAIENGIRMRVRQERLEALRAELMGRWRPVIHEQALAAENFFGAESPDIILAEAGEEHIGLREFRNSLPMEMLSVLPERVALSRIRRLLVEKALFDRLLILEGLRLGYGNRPEVLRVQNGMLLEKILAEYVYAGISVSDEEIAAYYRDHPKEFSHPARAKVRSILVFSEGEAGAIRDAISQGKDFATLAREQSKDALTSAIGGEMGWMVEGRARPPFSSVVFTLPPQEVSVARDGEGYRVIQVVAREEAKVRPRDEVREEARARALAAKQRGEARRWIGTLRNASTIQVLEAGIVEAEQAYQEQLKAKIEQRRSKN